MIDIEELIKNYGVRAIPLIDSYVCHLEELEKQYDEIVDVSNEILGSFIRESGKLMERMQTIVDLQKKITEKKSSQIRNLAEWIELIEIQNASDRAKKAIEKTSTLSKGTSVCAPECSSDSDSDATV